MTAAHLTNLADNPELVPLLAEWHHRQFGYLARSLSLDQRVARFQSHLQHGALPTTFVAWAEGVPVGCASLVVNDMNILPMWIPWLAGVYVLPEQRGLGIGSMLIQRVTQEAVAHHHARCYLYTLDRASFYTSLGWRTIFTRLYRGYVMTVMATDLPTV